MRDNDLSNKIDNGRAALEFCGLGIRLRDIALEAVFAPELDFLLNAKASLPDAKPIDVPSFENEGRIGQNTGRSDLVDRRIEVERRGSDRRIDAPRNRNDTFHGRAGQRLVASLCRQQPQRCYGCSDRGQAKDAARAGHGVALRTSLLSTVPVSPCTLAPRESCHRPAIPNVAL